DNASLRALAGDPDAKIIYDLKSDKATPKGSPKSDTPQKGVVAKGSNAALGKLDAAREEARAEVKALAEKLELAQQRLAELDAAASGYVPKKIINKGLDNSDFKP